MAEGSGPLYGDARLEIGSKKMENENKQGETNMKFAKHGLSFFLLSIVLVICAGCSTHTAFSGTQFNIAKSHDGSPIAFEVKGNDQPTLVFIHGWTGDHTVWDKQFDYFADKYQVVRMDLAGRGRSGSRRATYSMETYGRDVAAVVDKIGATAVVLIGHSMGGPVAVEGADILGDKVKGIVVVDNFHTPLFFIPEQAKLKMLDSLKSGYSDNFGGMVAPMFTRSATPETVREITNKMAAVDQDVSVSSLYECILWNSREADFHLSKYEGKLYNINASPDGNTLSPREDVVLIPEVGHFIQVVKPDAFNAALENYLKQMK